MPRAEVLHMTVCKSAQFHDYRPLSSNRDCGNAPPMSCAGQSNKSGLGSAKLKVAPSCHRKSQPELICRAILSRDPKFEEQVNILSSPELTSAEITKHSFRKMCLLVFALPQKSLCARRMVVKSRVCTMRVNCRKRPTVIRHWQRYLQSFDSGTRRRRAAHA